MLGRGGCSNLRGWKAVGPEGAEQPLDLHSGKSLAALAQALLRAGAKKAPSKKKGKKAGEKAKAEGCAAAGRGAGIAQNGGLEGRHTGLVACGSAVVRRVHACALGAAGYRTGRGSCHPPPCFDSSVSAEVSVNPPLPVSARPHPQLVFEHSHPTPRSPCPTPPHHVQSLCAGRAAV